MTKIRMVSRFAGFVLVTGGSPSSGVGEGAGVVAGTGVGVATTTGDGEGVGAAGWDPPQDGSTTNTANSTSQLFCITPLSREGSHDEETTRLTGPRGPVNDGGPCRPAPPPHAPPDRGRRGRGRARRRPRPTWDAGRAR